MKILFAFLFILLSNLVIAQGILVIKNSKEVINISKNVSVLEDKENNLSIKDVLTDELQSKFVLNATEDIAFSNKISSTWAKFSLKNTSGKELFLQVEDFLMPNFEIYIPTGIPDSFRVKKFGASVPYFSREAITNFYLISLVEAQDSSVNTFYIDFHHKFVNTTYLKISEAKSFFQENHERDVFYGIFLGVMSVMALYNFFIYLTVRNITYLYYVGHIVMSSLSTLTFAGYGFNLFWYNYPQMNELILPFTIGTPFIFLIIFSISFLNTSKYAPLAQKGLYGFIGVFIVNIIYSSVTQTAGIEISLLITLTLCVYLLSLAVYIYRKGNKAARFYILASGSFLLGVIVIVLMSMQILPKNIFTANSSLIGAILEVLFFSFALTDNIRTLTVEREEAQIRNLVLIQEQKDTLETKVKEKTVELEQKNNEMFAQNEELLQQQEKLIAVNDNLESKNKLIESQKAKIDEQIANFERANAKLKANEYILKKSYTKLKESEDKIKKQNAEMLAQNEELRQQQEELMSINEVLEITFKELKTTSDRLNKSIKYANQIQQVILPQKSKLDNFFSEHFITYLPKDVVSGDFYWFALLEENKAIFVLADCTGHGVPGAFMSMIGNTLLHEIIKVKNIESPAEILLELHKGIRNVLKQEESKNSDGMDISICFFEKDATNEAYKVTFSGAKSSIFYIKDKQITQLDGNRISIGGFTERKREFTNQVFTLKEGEVIYFTSDGYIDQHNFERKRFSSAKFKELVSSVGSLSIKEQEELILSTLKEYQQAEEQRDDISVIGIRL